MKRYLFEHCMNLRDIGGYPIKGSGNISYSYIPYHCFLRSDAPVKLSEDEIHILQSMHISTVIDLRYMKEAKRRPCALQEVEGISYYNISIGDGRLPEREEEIYKSYLEFTKKKEEILQIFQIFANATGGVLYHCTAGKDRTGVITALLLLFAGAEESDILADYQVSYTYIRKLIVQLRADNPDLPAFAGQSKLEYMEQFIHGFLSEYQSVEAYLRHIGLTEIELNKLKAKLVKTTEFVV